MMEYISLSLVLDVLILVLLVATIIYASRLTFYLKRFKQSRDELDGIVKDLSLHIDKAEKSVNALYEAADESGVDLQRRLDKARAMFDELDIVVQTGDALASRLENLAVRNRKIIEGGDSDIVDLAKATGVISESDDGYDDRLHRVVQSVEAHQGDKDTPASSMFSIRDAEFERGDIDVDADGFTLDDDVLSEAERDLYEALQKKQSGRAKR